LNLARSGGVSPGRTSFIAAAAFISPVVIVDAGAIPPRRRLCGVVAHGFSAIQPRDRQADADIKKPAGYQRVF
jgi:hypothetical protein